MSKEWNYCGAYSDGAAFYDTGTQYTPVHWLPSAVSFNAYTELTILPDSATPLRFVGLPESSCNSSAVAPTHYHDTESVFTAGSSPGPITPFSWSTQLPYYYEDGTPQFQEPTGFPSYGPQTPVAELVAYTQGYRKSSTATAIHSSLVQAPPILRPWPIVSPTAPELTPTAYQSNLPPQHYVEAPGYNSPASMTPPLVLYPYAGIPPQNTANQGYAPPSPVAPPGVSYASSSHYAVDTLDGYYTAPYAGQSVDHTGHHVTSPYERSLPPPPSLPAAHSIPVYAGTYPTFPTGGGYQQAEVSPQVLIAGEQDSQTSPLPLRALGTIEASVLAVSQGSHGSVPTETFGQQMYHAKGCNLHHTDNAGEATSNRVSLRTFVHSKPHELVTDYRTLNVDHNSRAPTAPFVPHKSSYLLPTSICGHRSSDSPDNTAVPSTSNNTTPVRVIIPEGKIEPGVPKGYGRCPINNCHALLQACTVSGLTNHFKTKHRGWWLPGVPMHEKIRCPVSRCKERPRRDSYAKHFMRMHLPSDESLRPHACIVPGCQRRFLLKYLRDGHIYKDHYESREL